MAASSSLAIAAGALKTIIGIGMTNDLRIILLGQAWFMWIWAPVLKPENREELNQSLENYDWCWPVLSLAATLSFFLIPFLFFCTTLSFFSPSAHTSFEGLPRPWQKATAAKLAAWACLPASRAGIVFPEKRIHKHSHLLCWKSEVQGHFVQGAAIIF